MNVLTTGLYLREGTQSYVRYWLYYTALHKSLQKLRPPDFASSHGSKDFQPIAHTPSPGRVTMLISLGENSHSGLVVYEIQVPVPVHNYAPV